MLIRSLEEMLQQFSISNGSMFNDEDREGRERLLSLHFHSVIL